MKKQAIKPVDINEVAKDIIGIKFKKNQTLGQCLSEFYKVMRKYGIKQGTPAFNDDGKEVGVSVSRFEWTMCHELFITRLNDFFMIQDLLSVPKDLQK